MLVACGIGLQKIRVHNESVVNLLVWYIISAVAAPHWLAFAEREERREQAPKDLWPLEWLGACIHRCFGTTASYVALLILFWDFLINVDIPLHEKTSP